MNTHKNKVQKIGNIIVSLILIMPIVRYYNIPGTNIGSNSALTLFLCLLASFAVLYNNRFICSSTSNTTIRQSRLYFLLFLIWSSFITLYYEYEGLASNNLNNAIVAFLSCYVMALMLTNRINISQIFKIYEILVYIVLIVLLIQWLFSLVGIEMDFRLPFHKFNGAWGFSDDIKFGMDGVNTSLFSEPAHISEFLMPFLCYSLFCPDVSKRNKRMALLTSISIVLTISGTGIVLLGVVWLLYLTLFNENKGSNKYLIGLLGVVVLIVLYFILQSLENYDTMLGKLFFSSDGSMEGNKSSFRIYRGWDYVFKMPFSELITGVGFVHMEKYTSIHGIWSIFDNDFKIFEWFSGITEILLYFGLIGFIPFCVHVYKLYKKQSILTKSLVIVFVLLLFTSQILFQETHFFYLALIVGSIQYSDIYNERKQIITIQ